MATEEKNESKLGVLSSQDIKGLIAEGVISSTDPGEPITQAQVQPASLDLRLGATVYRVLASFLPEKEDVLTRLHQLDMYGGDIEMYELDITEPRVLEKGQVYLIPLMEELKLPSTLSGRANPKSTTGRLDIFTRVITDKNHRFDDIARGYKGQLFLEVMPRSWSIRVQKGQSLVQLRLAQGKGQDYILANKPLEKLNDDEKLLYIDEEPVTDVNITKKGLFMSVDLSGDNPESIIGYRSKRNSHYIDLSKVNFYEIEEFWEPIYKKTIKDTLILEPEEFYILASKEKIRIPNGFAAELVPFEAGSGELRTHYAGFFDPGFGYGNNGEMTGTKAVLEVRAHDIPFMIADGQTICKFNFEKMASKPEILYGTDIGSSYQGQGIKLSKHFKDGQS
ncbi:MAG: 2'-deoxycytidine 5'-triphosphate deaminase [Proteobacteria bacterium]|nr:2'-deoxycytidine 5'-triphosphate deaminase [Pseudomonadota bacterium]